MAVVAAAADHAIEVSSAPTISAQVASSSVGSRARKTLQHEKWVHVVLRISAAGALVRAVATRSATTKVPPCASPAFAATIDRRRRAAMEANAMTSRWE